MWNHALLPSILLPSPLMASAGSTRKNAENRTMAMPTAQPIAPFESRSSSGTCRLADHDNARKPSAMDSPSVVMPRTNGTLA